LHRLEQIRDQLFRVVVPADHVDSLAVEFVDDILDPAAADADARPDCVY
jgi:hypothetical protein